MNEMKNRKGLLRRAGETAVKLVYPPCCPICDAVLPLRGGLICSACEKKLPWVTEPACMKCGKPLAREEAEYCADCAKIRHLFDCGRGAFAYTGELRKSIYRMKAQNRRDYLDFYADSMVRAGKRYLALWKPEVIVPIPMHWRKKLRRGYNQSELLAVRISLLTGIPCERHLLRCVRYTGQQKELGAEERRKNLKGSFALRQGAAVPSRVLLADDVYTTGSTIDEASRVLRGAGVQQIFFLVLCVGKGKKSLHGSESVLY